MLDNLSCRVNPGSPPATMHFEPEWQPGRECPECGRQHRSWRLVAKCRWPRAIWITGNPPASRPCFALVSYCPPGATVTLWDTLARAEERKRGIDKFACGGRCWRDHRIIALGEEATP
jgi:hypothetical protein